MQEGRSRSNEECREERSRSVPASYTSLLYIFSCTRLLYTLRVHPSYTTGAACLAYHRESMNRDKTKLWALREAGFSLRGVWRSFFFKSCDVYAKIELFAEMAVQDVTNSE